MRVRRLNERQRLVTVDLLNPPPREQGRADADESDYPAPQTDLTVTFQPASNERVTSAWFLSPDLPEMQRRLEPQISAGRAAVQVAELKYWGIVVFELQAGG